MSRDVNASVLVGRLSRDAETSQVGDKKVAKFSLAVGYYSKQNPDAVSFFDIEYWNPGGLVQYLVKGRPVAIAGEMRQDRWQDNEGQNRSKVKVIAHVVQLLGNGNTSADQGANPYTQAPGAGDDRPDDISF